MKQNKTRYYLAFKCVGDDFRSAFVNPKNPASVQYEIGKRIVYPKAMNGFLAELVGGFNPLLSANLRTGCAGYWTRVLVVKVPAKDLSSAPPYLTDMDETPDESLWVSVEKIQSAIRDQLIMGETGNYPGAASLTVLEEVKDYKDISAKDALRRYARKYHLRWIPQYKE